MKDKDTKLLEEAYDTINSWDWPIKQLSKDQLEKLPDHRLRNYFRKLQHIYHMSTYKDIDNPKYTIDQNDKESLIKLHKLYITVKDILSKRGHIQ